jgi:beta-lactamase class D
VPPSFDPRRRALLLATAAMTAAGMFPHGALAAGSPASGLDDEFAKRAVQGTFAHLDVTTDRLTLVNEHRAQKRYIPASTFKIPNSLIALETGIVTGPDEVFKWDGKPAAMKEWERDMTFSEAIRVSNVPIYQRIARRVGLKNYEVWLDRLGYGNANPGTVVDRFWLDGPLAISAIEQTSFLAALALQELPMSKTAQSAVKGMLLQETRDGRSLYAKTGWLGAGQIGWWVGWVEGNGRIDSFALNMDVPSEADLPKRKEIGLAMLARLGIYPA